MLNYNKAEFETSFGTVSQLKLSPESEIVFSGRSNVGKSSLINKLFNRRNFARVSATPGKTVTINFFKVEDVRFADLPGYGFAKRSEGEKRRWAQLMEHYFSSGRNIRLVLQLVDIRHPATADDLDMLNYLKHNEIPFIIVLTKADKLNKTERARRMEAIPTELKGFEDIIKIPFSAVNGEGVEAVKAEIEKMI